MESGPANVHKRSWKSITLAIVGLGVLIACAGGSYVGLWRYHLKRFDAVAPGVLYRCGQPSEWGMRHLIQHHGVKTIVSVRRNDHPLKALLPGGADGELRESEWVEKLGGRFVHWPQGDEVYWPWMSPQFIDAFYELLDHPENLPVVVHCMGGRHRTGNFVALYRLEYERWPVSRVLEEMYSYEFGPPVPLQEHNLRTYRCRPRPEAEVWERLAAMFERVAPVNDYEDLVRRIRQGQYPGDLEVLQAMLEERQPFGLCMAERVIDSAVHPLTPFALEFAMVMLAAEEASPHSWSSAAALIADWAQPHQQQQLLAYLENDPRDAPPTPRFQAVVTGVTNRYAANRVPYLVPLLNDERHHLSQDAKAYRYCDTAAARLVSITNAPLVGGANLTHREGWDRLVEAARKHLDEVRELRQLRQYEVALLDQFHRTPDSAADRDDYRN